MKHKRGAKTNRSALHQQVYDLLVSMYPGYHIHEETSVRLQSGQTLFIDMCIRELQFAFECHGRQHYEFVAHFHSSPAGFYQQQERDAQKAIAICEAGYTLIVVKYNDELNRRSLMKKIEQAQQNQE